MITIKTNNIMAQAQDIKCFELIATVEETHANNTPAPRNYTRSCGFIINTREQAMQYVIEHAQSAAQAFAQLGRFTKSWYDKESVCLHIKQYTEDEEFISSQFTEYTLRECALISEASIQLNTASK